jgi:hypothetical protein
MMPITSGRRTVRGACPVCDRGPRDTALAITTDERGTVAYCHRCGYVATETLQRRPIEPTRTTASTEPLEWSNTAERIWRRTQGLAGTLGEVYLRFRGCVLPPRDSALRYLSASDTYPPSLCAAVSDVRTAHPITLHFTRLAPDGRGKAGTDCDKLLLAGHRKRRGCIRLWPNEDVESHLTLAEGIESALAAAHAYTPVWSTVDASNLACFPVLQGIDSLTIVADHDHVGIAAAQTCAQRWREAEHVVRVLRPRTPGEDCADIARRAVSH